MSQFEESGWDREDGCREYLENADIYIQDRRALLDVLRSFYRAFVGPESPRKVLDLGCGDGVIGEALKSLDPSIALTAVDGSEDMIVAAKSRLARWEDVECSVKTFQDILRGSLPWRSMGFIVSSFAIHHLAPDEKKALFRRVLEMLVPGGHFLNVDVVRPRCSRHEEWYDELWREWIVTKQREIASGQDFSNVPEEARKKPENRYEKLEDQLLWLEEAGFVEVECHYRRGLFGVYGGRRPPPA